MGSFVLLRCLFFRWLKVQRGSLNMTKDHPMALLICFLRTWSQLILNHDCCLYLTIVTSFFGKIYNGRVYVYYNFVRKCSWIYPIRFRSSRRILLITNDQLNFRFLWNFDINLSKHFYRLKCRKRTCEHCDLYSNLSSTFHKLIIFFL